MNLNKTPWLALPGLALACSSALAVDYNTTADYLSISIEAEEYISKDDRWVMTDASTPQLPAAEDPDGNHSASASGGVYFELLPDVRVTHADPMGPPTAYWGQAGTGPQMSWAINFPEAGRYYVHGRAFSTGTEDNGIHVGLDGNWPPSARMMQFCTAGSNAWKWSSAQREAGGVGSCGLQKTLYLDVAAPGPATLSVSAREDGFELDRIVLIKDLSGNTKTCTPTTATGISCTNGGIEMADGQTDVAVTLETTPNTVMTGPDELSEGSSFTVSAVIENHDKFDNSDDIETTLTFATGLDVTAVPSDCSVAGQVVTCTLASLHPTAANQNHTHTIDVTVGQSGSALRSVDAIVQTSVMETSYANNDASFDVSVSGVNLSTDVSVAVALQKDAGGDNLQWETSEQGTLTVTVENTSAQDAGTVDADVTLSAGVDVNLMPGDCSGSSPIVCSLTDLPAGSTHDFEFEITADDEGAQVMTAAIAVANDTDSSNDSDTLIAVFEEPAPPATTGGSDGSAGGASGGTTAGATDGGTGTTTAGSTDGGAGTTTAGGTDGTTGGSTTGGTDGGSGSAVDGGTTPTTTSSSADAVERGALGWKTLLALLLLVSTSVYWRHYRQPVAIRQRLKREL